MKPSYLVHQRGLFRCCTQMIDDYMATLPSGLAAPGDKLTCKTCGGQMVYAAGAWRALKKATTP